MLSGTVSPSSVSGFFLFRVAYGFFRKPTPPPSGHESDQGPTYSKVVGNIWVGAEKGVAWVTQEVAPTGEERNNIEYPRR